MKKLLFAIFAFILLTKLFFNPLRAQEIDFNQTQSDYLYLYSQYRQAHSDYLVARQAYLSYQTLTSKTEAQNKTLKMLQLRNQVIKAYLAVLKLKLTATAKTSGSDQNLLYLKLNQEVFWYNDHEQNLTSAGTLEDLVESSNEAQKRYLQTEALVYQTLGAILAEKENALRGKIYQQIEVLRTKIREIREKRDKQTTIAERWLLEAENRLRRSEEKQILALQTIQKINFSDTDKFQKYSQAQFIFEESHQYLKEANAYLLELVREIKSAD